MKDEGGQELRGKMRAQNGWGRGGGIKILTKISQIRRDGRKGKRKYSDEERTRERVKCRE